MPGTLGPKPAGLTSGEPGGAILAGACNPGAPEDTSPNMALAMRASDAGSNGATRAGQSRMEWTGKAHSAPYL